MTFFVNKLGGTDIETLSQGILSKRYVSSAINYLNAFMSISDQVTILELVYIYNDLH